MVRVAVRQAVSPGPYSNQSQSEGGVSPFNDDSRRPASQLSNQSSRSPLPDITIVYNCSSFEDLQAQNEETNEFLTSLIMAGGANNNNSSQDQQQNQQTNATMASQSHSQSQYNNNNQNNRFNKTKSGSLPGRYTTTTPIAPSPSVSAYPPYSYAYSPSGSGRQSQNPPSPISPSAYYHNYSARPYSFMPATQPTTPSPTATTAMGQQHEQQLQYRPPPITSVIPPGSGRDKEKDREPGSKKWNPFGGLFKRKDKHSSQHQQHHQSKAGAPIPISTTTVAAIPVKIQFEASQRPRPASGSAVISSGEDDIQSMSDSSSSADGRSHSHKKRSSFLERISRGSSDKKKKHPKVVHADLLRVPGAPAGGPPGPVIRRQHPNGRPAPAQNRYSQPILQSWETTKKIAVVPPTSASSLLMLNQAGPNNNMYPYSDSGSLSLSLEGGSSLTKGSRSAKEATKARAEARRNSYIHEDSSSDDEALRSGSYQGSHSSLSLRNKKNGVKNGSGTRMGMGLAPMRPALPSADNLGLPLLPQQSQQHQHLHQFQQQQSSTSSPTLHQHHQQIPTSPRWEARVVYTKETLEDDGKPVVVRLPRYANGAIASASASAINYRPGTAQETLSSDVNEDGQIVVTAGLRVPFAMHPDRVTVNTAIAEPIYANTKGSTAASPIPPKGGGNFYRPASCSFLDAYRREREESQQPQSLVQYEKEPARLRSPMEDYQNHSSRDTRMPVLSSPVPLSAASVASKLLPMPSSPVHSRAATFWKQKEQETLHQSSGNGSISPSPSPVAIRERPPVARIRSADSSPLLLPKNASNGNGSGPTRAQQTQPQANTNANTSNGKPVHRSLNSTESISSLSSFTTNETKSPSPRPPSRNAMRGKIPAGHQQRSSYRSNRTPVGQHGLGILSPNPTARSTPLGHQSSSEDARNNNTGLGSRASSTSIKSPGRNLEDALNELEDMYKSLQLSDEDLLDRAERRDLPTPHQELRNKDLGYFNFDETDSHSHPHAHAYINGASINGVSANGNGHISPTRIQSPIYYYSPSPTGYAVGSLESLASGTGTSGSGEMGHYGRRPGSRVRAPPLRRSGVPDPVKDDMAKRKYESNAKEPKVVDARDQISQSYLVLSPAFSPPVSPIPGSIDAGQQYQNYDPSQSNLLVSKPNDPDLTLDDVTVRNYKRANAIRIIPEPQPKFGIPLGPITKAPNSDYLHATPVERFRPLYRHVKNPDLVKDDVGFRALRKDLNQETNNLNAGQWTPKLFSPLRNFENVFNYNVINGDGDVGDGGGQPEDEKAKNKRVRAVRSLSANITSLQTNLMGKSPSPTPNSTSMARQQPVPVNSFYSLTGSGKEQFGNNSDYKFYKTRSVTPSHTVSAPNGNGHANINGAPAAGNYMEPSWVQQIELDPDELRELKRSLSPTRIMPLIRSRDVNPIRHRPPATRSSSSPAASSSPPKPRRPWTDLILDGLEKEEEAKREEEARRLQEEHEYQNGHEYGANYDYDHDDDDEEDEMFMDASSQTPRDSPVRSYKYNESPTIKHVEPPRSNASFLPGGGQKNRRGSWAEPNTHSHVTQLYPETGVDSSSHKNGNGGRGADELFVLKRRSWSDFPQSPSGSGSGPHPTTTTTTTAGAAVVTGAKLDFNPIAPPRRVKQINLEGFHSSTSKPNTDEQETYEPPQQQQPKPTSILKQPSVSSTKGEQELDNLIHALVQEADTCGSSPSQSATPQESGALAKVEPKRKRKIEIKARYPIDDDEDLFRSSMSTNLVPGLGSTGSAGSIEVSAGEHQAEPRIHTYTIEPNTAHDPITKLIKTINENLVPSLEKSIRESETRRSQMNLAMEGSAQQTTEEKASEEKCEPKTSASPKPKPLPRHKPSNVADESMTDSPLNSSTDKQSQSKEFGRTSAFSPVTQSSLAKPIPAIQVTDLDTSASGKSDKQPSFLRPKKDSDHGTTLTATTNGDDGSKRDSLTDAEGMTFVKKLLSRENSASAWVQQEQKQAPAPAALVPDHSNYFLIHGGRGIKKSPSTGTTNMSSTLKTASNWSGANANLNLATPPFLRKYFKDMSPAGVDTQTQQQPAPSTNTRASSFFEPKPADVAPLQIPRPQLEVDVKPKDVLALNVAQKANLFMKMEHEQRFSKWRKQADGQTTAVVTPGGLGVPKTTGSRFSTQPVTNQELSSALSMGQAPKSAVTSQAQPPSQPQLEPDVLRNDSSFEQSESGASRTLSKSKDDDPTTEREREREKRKSSISSVGSIGSSFGVVSVSAPKPAARIEPSCLSIKDRVSLFNRISSIPTATATVNPIPIPVSTTTSTSTNNILIKSPTFAQPAPESSPQLVHRRIWSTQAHHTDNANANASGATTTTTSSGHHRESSAHFDGHRRDHDKYSLRQTKGKSLSVGVGHSWEPDYASEDGEVSSGGQEVSDIISKSYDNSPMFRKKSWKSQIPQPSLSKEIWRKFESHKVGQEHQELQPAPAPCAAIAAAPLTSSSSSNLLSILRVLSSSDDGLDPEPDTPDYAAQLKIDAASSQAKDPSKKSVRKYLKMRTATTTAAEESFQTQPQPKLRPQESIYDNVSARVNPVAVPMPVTSSPPPETSFSAVKREGDMLIMKKHMPTVKRKSSQKASKNPLKALAARLDFRNQD